MVVRGSGARIAGACREAVDVSVWCPEVQPSLAALNDRLAEDLDPGRTQLVERGRQVIDEARGNRAGREGTRIRVGGPEHLELRGVRHLAPPEILAYDFQRHTQRVAEERHRLVKRLGPHPDPDDAVDLHAEK